MADKKRDPREALLMARGRARTACAVLSFNWSPLFNSWSISADSHHQEPVISLMLTSSGIDPIVHSSISTSQVYLWKRVAMLLYP